MSHRTDLWEIFFDQVPIGLALVDRQGRFIKVNPYYCSLVGYAQAELKDCTFQMMTHPDDQEQGIQALNRLFQGEVSNFHLEKRYIRKDGSVIWVRLSGFLLNHSACLAIVQDMTDFYAVKGALQQSEARYARVVKAASIGFYDWDLTTNESYWNDSNYALLDIPKTETLPNFKLVLERLEPDDRAAIKSAMTALLELGVPYEQEYRIRLNDGTYRYVLSRGRVSERNAVGQPTSISGILTDITDLKQIEESLRIYTAKLEQGNKELERFATVASHALQEPLRKIRMFSDHLSKAIQETLSEEALDDLARIQNAVSRMQRLIDDLLDLSRVTRRGQPFQKVDLRILLGEVIAELRDTFKDIHNRVEINGDLIIEADVNQMRQMLTQLLDNALKFHEPGKPSHVSVSILSMNGTKCQITVDDNGLGINPEYLSKIFDIFVCLHGKEYPGTGIGLSLVQKIVERHEGSIAVNSTPGKGSRFIVTLPIIQMKK